MGEIVIRRTGAKEYGRWIKALIASSSGSGKTLLASTAPEPFIVNMGDESNLMTVASRKIPYTQISTIAELAQVKNLFKGDLEERTAKGLPFETIIIDTIDDVQSLVVKEYLIKHDKEFLSQQDYPRIREKTADIVRAFRNLDMHVIFNCNLKEVRDEETGHISYKPNVIGSYADQIASSMNIAGTILTESRVDPEDSSQRQAVRFLHTSQNSKYDWLTDDSYKLPSKFELTFVDDFVRIADIIFDDIIDVEEEEPIIINTGQDIADSASVAPVLPTSTAPEINGILVRNELPDGIEPVVLDYGTNTFCVRCGNEIEDEKQIELSRLRFRELYCKKHYSTAQRNGKSQ